MSDLIKFNQDYKKWIEEVSLRFRQSQLKAAVKANDSMLRFYWGLGRDISKWSKQAVYGSGFYETVSKDLQDIFPTVKSFSTTKPPRIATRSEVNTPAVGAEARVRTFIL